MANILKAGAVKKGYSFSIWHYRCIAGLQITVGHLSNKIPTVVRHDVWTIFFIVNHFMVKMNKHLPWVNQVSFSLMSDHNLFCPRKIVFVPHMSSQEEKIICSPALYLGLYITLSFWNLLQNSAMFVNAWLCVTKFCVTVVIWFLWFTICKISSMLVTR